VLRVDYLVDVIRDEKCGGHVARVGEMIKACKNVIGMRE
jgi:hypothetical protein